MTKRPKHARHGRREQAKLQRRRGLPSRRQYAERTEVLIHAGAERFEAFTAAVRGFSASIAEAKADALFEAQARGEAPLHPVRTPNPGVLNANLVRELPQDYVAGSPRARRLHRIPGGLIQVPRVMPAEVREARRGRRA